MDSLAQSFVYYLTQKYNELRKFEDKIDAFITPSKFTKDTIQKSTTVQEFSSFITFLPLLRSFKS